MLISTQGGAIKKFRRTSWKFQQTFRTPLKSLASFTATILNAADQVSSGSVILDAVVMQPTRLYRLLSDNNLSQDLGHDTLIAAETAAEVHSLLTAALGDWLDFWLAPTPKPFVLYADHDEYVTFFASRKSNLNTVASALIAQGFATVEGYVREF